MPDKAALAYYIEHPDGARTRWGPDEVEPDSQPSGLTITTQIPGGDQAATETLPRRVDLDYPDLGLADRVTIRGLGRGDRRIAFMGTQAEFPREHDQGFSISVGAVGRSELLKRDTNFRPVYVDRDPGSWKALSLLRRVAIGSVPVDVDYRAESGGSFLQFEGPTDKQVLINSVAELHYQMSARQNAAKAMYRGTEANTTNVESARIYTDDNEGFSSGTSNAITLDDTLRTVTFSAVERYLMMRAMASGTHTPTAAFNRRLSKIAVYGDYGLTTRAITGEPDGIWLSDIVDHIVQDCAPQLPRDVDLNTTVIPHLAFDSPVTAEEAILAANKYSFWEYGVYEGRFFYREPSAERLTWDCRLDGGAGVVLEGAQSEDIYDCAIVYFTDFDGQTRCVGPPGFGCDYETDLLQVTDSTNPYVAWGEPRPGKLEISSLTSQVGATLIGMAWLAEASVPKRRGTLIFRGSARHPTIGERPCWAIRAGDWVSIGDHPASLPRRIIRTDYRHDARELTAQLDNTPLLVEPILEAMGVNLVGVA